MKWKEETLAAAMTMDGFDSNDDGYDDNDASMLVLLFFIIPSSSYNLYSLFGSSSPPLWLAAVSTNFEVVAWFYALWAVAVADDGGGGQRQRRMTEDDGGDKENTRL